MRRPYLTSVGLTIPLLGVRWHGYRRTRGQHHGHLHFLGVGLVWTSYRRSDPSRF